VRNRVCPWGIAWQNLIWLNQGGWLEALHGAFMTA
jgi:hypothetical protein